MLLISWVTPLLLGGLLLAGQALPPGARGPVTTAAMRLAPAAALPALLLPLSPETPTLELPGLLLGTTLTMDGPARPLVALAALVHAAALVTVAWAAPSAPSGSERDASDRSLPPGVLSAFLLLCLGGTLGVCLAADVVTFYVMFALMSFSAAGLVVHHLDGAAVRATRVYLVMSVVSETALLAALLLVFAAGGRTMAEAPDAVVDSEHTGLVLVLLGVGLGIKVGVVPLHLWLPLAHPAAPPAASAVLSGVLVAAGLLGILRLTPDQAQPAAGAVLLVVALLGGLLAAAAGAVQEDPKVVLAYSTISQMGLLVAVAAVALLQPQAAPAVTAAAVLYVVHHGLVKGALFLGVPLLRGGGGRAVRALVVGGSVLCALSLAGAPLTTGWVAKYAAKEAVQEASPALEQLLPLVAVGSTVLMVRLAWTLREGGSGDPPASAALGAWLGLVLLGAGLPWWITGGWLDVAVPGAEAAVVWDGLWPLLVGAALCGLAVPAARAVGRPRIPAGDLVVATESGARVLSRALHAGTGAAHRFTGQSAARWRELWSGAAERGRSLGSRADAGLQDWGRSGAALLVLLVLVSLIVLVAGGG
ncbi:proton-conducting transporter membrane subunit [Nesterenkonia sp. HG001]|uniref:proton-conducting transporter transmembrane domain-containing protein n=1 Tax=Nesterenkonia sp. HG001 TaxID=2983207 RepID=UPI002AC6A4A5|nr:proton-conducting transporter membrane subunit [Nesterenkonia sp. HG001]MDZ5077417.1 proton-conducting transporter membrane subunit [Nesterenkonia sp. HG001]